MSDLISREDAIGAVVSWTVEDRPHEIMPTDLVDRIKALPSADAVEVVRCKDCKYNLGKTRSGRTILCNYCSHGMLIERNNEWYCADGERKKP